MRIVYPETANRSLESIDALFSTDKPFNWNMERAYREHGDVLHEGRQSDGSVMEDPSEGDKAKRSSHGAHVWDGVP